MAVPRREVRAVSRRVQEHHKVEVQPVHKASVVERDRLVAWELVALRASAVVPAQPTVAVAR